MHKLIKALTTSAVAHGYDNQPAIDRLTKHVETLERQSVRQSAPSKSSIQNTELAKDLTARMEPGKDYNSHEVREILLAVTGWGDISPQKTTAIMRMALSLELVSRKRDDATGRPLYFL